MNIKRLKTLKEQMSEEQKRKLLIGLRKIKECGGTGNVGGEIGTGLDADGPPVNEDEFTVATKSEPNVIAKTFDTNADFDSYVNQRRGIEITPKEQQALMTERRFNELAPSPARPSAPSQPTNQPAPAQPEAEDDEVVVGDDIQVSKSITFVDDTQGANILADFIDSLGLQSVKPQPYRFGIKFEQTDAFGLNDTTVIKKLKEGGQFCWTAFSKHESAEEEGNPGSNKEEKPEEPEKEEEPQL